MLTEEKIPALGSTSQQLRADDVHASFYLKLKIFNREDDSKTPNYVESPLFTLTQSQKHNRIFRMNLISITLTVL